MPSQRLFRIVPLLVLALLAAILFFWSGHFKESTKTQLAAVVPPASPRPIPEALHDLHAEIKTLQKSGDFRLAARRYPRLLEELSRLWGAGSADLSPYYYDFALALKLAGSQAECLKVTAQALKTWPSTLQLEVLDATARAESSLARGGFDPRADSLFRTILTDENLPKLRGLRIDLPALYAQWSEMLRLASRTEDALQISEKGLSLDQHHRQCRETKAKLLLGLERPREALPILKQLVSERSTPQVEFCLGSALLGSGDAAGAWESFSSLMKNGLETKTLVPEDPMSFGLELQAAKALNELGRPAEAAKVLFALLSREPEKVEALHELAKAAKAVGAKTAADSLNRRIRQLVPREKLFQSARQARGAGYPGSVLYYQAEAALFLENTGEALELFEKALRLSPRIALLHLEMARVHLLLGRSDLAEHDLREGLRQRASPLLAADLARVLALQGQVNASRSLLLELPPQPAAADREEEETGWGTEEKKLLAVRRARAFLELGEPSMASKILEDESLSREESGEALLCRAEIAIREHKLEVAGKILESSHDPVSGLQAWANALQALLSSSDANHGKSAAWKLPEDPSDLLDHPRLYMSPAFQAPEPGSPEGMRGTSRSWAGIRSAHERRLEIFSRMRGYSDSDVVPLWRDLLSLYQELKAVRKAREVAWYLVHLRPNGGEEWRELARTLTAPEEVMARISALETALKIRPGEKELEEKLAAARAGLCGS